MRDRSKHFVEVNEWCSVFLDGNQISTSVTVQMFLRNVGNVHIALRKFKGATPRKFRLMKTKRFTMGFVNGRARNRVWLCSEEMHSIFGVRGKKFTMWYKKV